MAHVPVKQLQFEGQRIERQDDAGRISIDSIRLLNTEGPSNDVEDYEVVAFKNPAARSSDGQP
jgi:hypothetical protein